jgi:transposase
VGVQVAERWILARLRNDTFFSLPQANEAVQTLLRDLNTRPFKKLPGSRQSLFESLDRPALRPLPAQPYAYAEWKRARVNIDYHVEVEGHYYSVPYTLVKQQIDVRLTTHVVELLFKGKRVASHRRSHLKGRHSTVTAHMPKAHQHYAQWTPKRLTQWAATSGVATSRGEHSVILTPLISGIDAAQTPDGRCHCTSHTAAPTSDCCWPRTTRHRSVSSEHDR